MSQASESNIHKSELASIAEGAGITFVGRIMDVGFRYLYMVILARILGPRLLGILLLGLTIVAFAGIISRFGLEIGVVRYVSLYKGLGDEGRIKGTIVQALAWSFIVSVSIGTGLFIGSRFLSVSVFAKPELQPVIKLLSFSLPFLFAAVIALAYTQGLKMMKYVVWSRFLFWPLSNVVLALLFFFAGCGLNGMAAANTTSIFLTCILSMFFLVKCFPNIKHIKAVYEARKLLRISIPSAGIIFLTYVIMWTDILMLGYFKTSEEVAVYNMAMRTALLISLTLVSFGAIFAPIVSDLCNRKQMQKLGALFKTVTRWNFGVSFSVFLLMALLSKEIMAMFGQRFIIGYAPLVILASAQLLNASVGSVGVVLIMSGKQDIMMWNNVGVCVLNILLNRLLIPPYGIIGAAIASGISIIASNVVMLLEVCILLRMHPYSRHFVKPLGASLVAFGIVVFVLNMLGNLVGVQKMLVSVLLFSAIFITVLYKLGFNDQDRFIIKTVKMKFANAARTCNEESNDSGPAR